MGGNTSYYGTMCIACTACLIANALTCSRQLPVSSGFRIEGQYERFVSVVLLESFSIIFQQSSGAWDLSSGQGKFTTAARSTGPAGASCAPAAATGSRRSRRGRRGSRSVLACASITSHA